MTVVKSSADTCKKQRGLNNPHNRSQHPTPEPSYSPSLLSTSQGAAYIDRSTQTQENVPRELRRGIRILYQGLPHPNHQDNHHISKPFKRTMSLPPANPKLPLPQRQAQRPDVHHLTRKYALPPDQIKLLQERLCVLESEQLRQEMTQHGQRLGRAFSEPEPSSRHTLILDSTSSRGVDAAMAFPPTRQEPPSSGFQGPYCTNTEVEMDGDNVMERNSVVELRLEAARRGKGDAMERYQAAAWSLQLAQERESALMFQQEMQLIRGRGQGADSARGDGSIAEYPSLFSQASSRAPSTYEQMPLFAPQHQQQHSDLHDQDQQQLHLHRYLQQQSQQHQQQHPSSSPVQVREFIRATEAQFTPPQSQHRSPAIQDQRLSVPRVPQLSDGASGTDPSFPMDHVAGHFEVRRGGHIELAGVAEKPDAPFRRYPASPHVKVKSEEYDLQTATPHHAAISSDRNTFGGNQGRSRYTDYNIPIEIPSSQGSESGANRGMESPSQTKVPAVGRSVRWRSPTPIPSRQENHQRRKNSSTPSYLPLPHISASRATFTTSAPVVGNSAPSGATSRHSSRPPPARSHIPRPRPYPPTSVPVSGSMPPPPPPAPRSSQRHNTCQHHAAGRARPRVARFSEFLTSIAQYPEFLDAGSHGYPGFPLVHYTHIEHVEHYHQSVPNQSQTVHRMRRDTPTEEMDYETEEESRDDQEGEDEEEGEEGEEQMEDDGERKPSPIF